MIMMQRSLYNVYQPDEIIRRLLQEVAPLDGISGYPVSIRYEADNGTEPPVIYFYLYEGADRLVFDMFLNQNTTIGEFETRLYSVKSLGLRRCVALCCEAIKNKTSFDVERSKAAKDEESDNLPF